MVELGPARPGVTCVIGHCITGFRGLGPDRGDVLDDEPVDELGVAQREHHGDLAAHRMADDVDGAGRGEVRTQRRGDVVGHGAVVELLRPVRAAVVREVDEEARALRLEALGDPGEVLAAAEQPVEEHDAALPVADGPGEEVDAV